MAPEERACEGVFMAFQYPVEIPGINNGYFLKAALNAVRKHRGEQELDAVEFMQLVRAKAKSLGMDQAMLSRSVNEGFSGGEKKRNEIFQMAVLEPRLAILDETDSGLDIDALKIVSEGVNALRSPDRAIIVVTHYQRLLNYIVPDFVHVLSGGRIVRSGGKELALELEAKGYGWVEAAAGGSEGLAMTAVAERHEAAGRRVRGVSPRSGVRRAASRSERAKPPFGRFLDADFRRRATRSGGSRTSRRSRRPTFVARRGRRRPRGRGRAVPVCRARRRASCSSTAAGPQALSSIDALPRGRQRPGASTLTRAVAAASAAIRRRRRAFVDLNAAFSRGRRRRSTSRRRPSSPSRCTSSTCRRRTRSPRWCSPRLRDHGRRGVRRSRSSRATPASATARR